ncbi:MAG: hypothetical protein V3W34_17250 [Phycisphaerae bacterium]
MFVLCWLGLPPPAAMGIDPPGPPTVSLNYRANDPLGPDGADSGHVKVEDCLNDATCDDDPKMHNETSITVAPWDPNLLLGAWNDGSKLSLDPAGDPHGIGFAISDDGGATWLRFDRDVNPDPCDLSCDPGFDCLVRGHSFNRDDLTFNPVDPANPCFTFLGTGQWDPATAAGGGAGGKYLYLGGYDVGGGGKFFARLRWGDPLTGWEVGYVAGSVVDLPKMAASSFTEDVYIVNSWAHLWASRCAGCDFINPALCEQGSPCVVGLDLAFFPSDLSESSEEGPNPFGTAIAVGPEGEINVAWMQPRGARDASGAVLDQIRYRRGEWNVAGTDLEFKPRLPLAGSTTCVEGDTCATPIVEGGYRGLSRSAVLGSTLVPFAFNFRMTPFPSIAVDRNDPTDLCGRGGTIYVAYPAEETPGGVSEIPSECDTTRTVDSNIYVVRGRVSTLPGETITWSAPVNVDLGNDFPTPVTCIDPDPEAPVPCGHHFPLQFFPWIAVDEQGRVGVMYFDTSPDTDPCDANVVYQITFAYSLDGGVTWEDPIVVSDELSETQVLDNSGVPIDAGIFIGDYAGMTATSNSSGYGLFHPIWTDLSEWSFDTEERWLRNRALTPGDIYTATVTVSEPVYSMGDYDRDGDVDMNDFAKIEPCANSGSTLPRSCELLDFDRDNDVDDHDADLFYDCFTGDPDPPPNNEPIPVDGPVIGLSSMVQWANESMSSGERASLADATLAASQLAGPQEATVMQDFAAAIDP